MPTIYPSAIARACSVIDESPVFRDLPDGYIRVLIRIVKKIRLSCPRSAIFASRETLAQESGKSVETVGRVVKWMEDRGLIQRTQKARAGLRGSTSPITPTVGLLQALALVEDAPPQPTPITDLLSAFGKATGRADPPSVAPAAASDLGLPAKPSASLEVARPAVVAPVEAPAAVLQAEAKPSDVRLTDPSAAHGGSTPPHATTASSNSTGVSQSRRPMPGDLKPLAASISEAVSVAPVAAPNTVPSTASPVRMDASKSTPLKQSKENQPARPAPFVKVDGCAVPTELAWLVTRNDLSATGVLALMKFAGIRKQRLSDIVQASRKYLEGLAGRSLFAYLRKLVMQDRDFRAVVEHEAKAHQEVQDKERLARKTCELEGRAFKSRDGRIQVFVKANGMLHQVGPDRSGYRPIDKHFLDAIEDGRLLPFAA